MLNFWKILEAAAGFIERLVNKPKPQPDTDVAKKALEEWRRERPGR